MSCNDPFFIESRKVVHDTWAKTSADAGKCLSSDADGKPILKYEFPRTMNSMAVFFSSASIKSGATYTVYTGGSLSGNTINWNGWFDDGDYTIGTKLGTFTSSSINTTVGQSNGPGGGPGGGPGNGGGGFGPGWWN